MLQLCSLNHSYQFFLELWAEISRQKSLRALVDGVPTLPRPSGNSGDVPEGTLFDALVVSFEKLAERAEEMIVHSVCGEVEAGLKAHFTGNSST